MNDADPSTAAVRPATVLGLELGIPGATCISMQRRARDVRFTNRYFVGRGIDVGGGIDSLGLYQEFFPLMREITVYDQGQGDAQFF